ncbi:MAG TPA: recombinase family protein [Symbiobacteriaceae bacterium]|nr:recombinase family protein [Symbiobacteriaceae bacterium]
MRTIRPDAVAIYIRWSTDEQTEGTTLQTQKERCSLYLRSQGWEVSEDLIFIDDGYSGGSLHRPALTRLRERVRTGRIDCVVTYSMDRLSRSVADTVQLVQNEWAGRCVYRSASQPISTEDGNPTGQLIFNILASFAEFERALIRERTHSGLVRRARQGMYPGTRVPPFGYRRDGKGQLAVDEAAAAVVRRIYAMAVTGPAGQGPTLIARSLAADGVRSPTGGPWWAHQVRAILQNPVYCGDLVYGRRRVNPAYRRDKSAVQRLQNQKPLAVAAGAVPAIVAREVWEQAQRLFAGRAAAHARKNLQAKNRSLLAGIARCRCGGPLSIFYDRQKRRHYRCSRHCLSAGGCPFGPGVVAADEVEALVARAVNERYATRELRAAAAAAAAAEWNTDHRRKPQQLGQAIAEADRRLAALAEDLARVRRAALRGEICLSAFEELRTAAEAERRELQAQRADLAGALAAARERLDATAADWAEAASRIDPWDALDIASRREILYGLLRSLVIFKPKGSDRSPEIDLVWEAR